MATTLAPGPSTNKSVNFPPGLPDYNKQALALPGTKKPGQTGKEHVYALSSMAFSVNPQIVQLTIETVSLLLHFLIFA